MAKKAKTTALTPEDRLQAALVPVEEQPYPVPGNWCWVTLGTIVNLVRGVSYVKQDAHSTKGENDCLIMRGGNIGEGSINLAADNVYVDKSLVSENQFVRKNDVIIVSSTGSKKVIGRAGVAFADYSDVAFGAFLTVARCRFPQYKSYVAYYFQSNLYRNRIRVLASGVNINNIRAEHINKTPFPVPPLPEQQRIVARIESLFAKLDEAKEKAQAALDSFETRKAAVLHRAFSGELTEEWRNKHSIEKESWSTVPLIEILREKPRNGYSPNPVSYPTAIKSMTLSAVTSGVFLPEYYKYIDAEIPADSYLWLEPGDILIQRANSLDKVGSSALYTGGSHEFIYPDLMMKLKLKGNIVNGFIAYQLKTDMVMRYIRENATGTAGNMPKINQKTVSSIPIVLPVAAEQAEIVRILDAFFDKEAQAKAQVEATLERIELMKKSILAKAFRGELGTNDPGEESVVVALGDILSTDL